MICFWLWSIYGFAFVWSVDLTITFDWLFVLTCCVWVLWLFWIYLLCCIVVCVLVARFTLFVWVFVGCVRFGLFGCFLFCLWYVCGCWLGLIRLYDEVVLNVGWLVSWFWFMSVWVVPGVYLFGMMFIVDYLLVWLCRTCRLLFAWCMLFWFVWLDCVCVLLIGLFVCNVCWLMWCLCLYLFSIVVLALWFC